MQKSDFKVFTKEYYNFVIMLATNNGKCNNNICSKCPFNKYNATNDKHCSNRGNNYMDEMTAANDPDPTLLQSAKDYLRLYRNEIPHVNGNNNQDVYAFAEWTSKNRYVMCVSGEWIDISNGLYNIVAQSTKDLYELYWMEKNHEHSDKLS